MFINQTNIPERNHQVRQMQQIYESSTQVIVWVGPDDEKNTSHDSDEPPTRAHQAITAITAISDHLLTHYLTTTTLPSLPSHSNIYRDLLYTNRSSLPPPHLLPLTPAPSFPALVWFFSHPYFTRVWVMQEINANQARLVHIGPYTTAWERVELVAGYLILDATFSQAYGFNSGVTHCWWAATLTTERIRRPKNWVMMLYLASNFFSLDRRDMIYGLGGLMKYSWENMDPEVGRLLQPDYKKSVVEVYRDSVEAALVGFGNTDVLLYVNGEDEEEEGEGKWPSWIPRWDRAMLFRNPFRFGNAFPWRPAGEGTTPVWRIKNYNETGVGDEYVLEMKGFVVEEIVGTRRYNQGYFNTAIMKKSMEENMELVEAWQRMLGLLSSSSRIEKGPVSRQSLAAAAMALSFGLDEDSALAQDEHVLLNLVAYLKTILPEGVFTRYISSDLATEAADADGYAFGKPVWDFDYPDSSFFVTPGGLVGCATSSSQPGDIVAVFLGSTYPMVLRPEGDYFRIRGYAYIHGIMDGERKDSVQTMFRIR
ncbi:hypothetical protein AtubIFM57258_007193 [Aspergillus tubingensis]|nr:hypothetical protein AtubIFM57258_007193 [Aspergillus tubingensis]